MAGISLTVTADTSQAIDILSNLKSSLRRMTPFYQTAGKIIEQSVHRAFETGRSPEGTPWSPLKTSKSGKKVLTESGRLMGSITSRAYSDHGEVGTNVVYAAVHQYGGKTRAHLIKPKHARALKFTLNGVPAFADSVQHPGSQIPARPFLGVDERAWEEIIAAGERYLEEATE